MNQRVFRRRIIISVFLLAAISVFFIIKLVSLHFSKRIIINNKKTVEVRRGYIKDRNGTILAVSIEYRSLCANPEEIDDPRAVSERLAPLLKTSPHALERRLNKEKRFVWLYRKLDDYTAEKIGRMKIRGIYFRREFKRVYPHGRLASNILGFVGIDGRGLEGIEYNYDDVLTGGYRDGTESEYGLKRGDNVWLTIDAFVQHVSEQEITKAVISHGARQGAVIVMDVKSGRILALGKYPGYNPNRYYDFTQFERRSYSVIDAFEPGSTMKIIALASLLENGKHVLNKTFSCSGSIDIGDATINCTGVHGDLGMDGVISKSCNVGIITAMKSISKNEFYQSLLKFGFGSKVCDELPGESEGILRPPEQWSGLSKYSMAIGHEMSATSLQLAAAFGAIANSGIMNAPSVIESIESPGGTIIQGFYPRSKGRIISRNTAQILLKLMRGVVENGTGQLADSQYYTVIGKTGTSKKFFRKGGYYSDRVLSSFAGIAPYRDPEVCILVFVDDPADKMSGGVIAAPVFSRIADRVLPVLGVKNSSIRARLPINKKEKQIRVNRGIMPDFRNMELRDAVLILSEIQKNSAVTYRIAGSGTVYAQKPHPGSALGDREHIILYLK